MQELEHGWWIEGGYQERWLGLHSGSAGSVCDPGGSEDGYLGALEGETLAYSHLATCGDPYHRIRNLREYCPAGQS